MRIYPYIFLGGVTLIVVGIGMFNSLTIFEGVGIVIAAILISLIEDVWLRYYIGWTK